MKNPVVIFFAQDRVVGDWQYKGPKFPVAWSDADELKDPTRDKIECKILILNDDDRAVPTLLHTNCDPDADLLVIRHFGSSHHRAEVLPDQLQHLGKYESIGSFSHEPDNDIFNRIRDLLCGRLTAPGFVQYFEKSRQRKLLIELAAICQIGLLGGSNVNGALLESVLFQFPADFQKIFNNAHGRNYDNWAAAINVVVSHASAIGD